MPNAPQVHGKGYRVKWKVKGTGAWQSKTLSRFDTNKANLDAAWALYTWLRDRNDAVLSTDPAIVQYAFLRKDQPLHAQVGAPTFRDLAEKVIAAKFKVVPRTRAARTAMIGNHFGDWADRPVSEITEDVLNAKAAELYEKSGQASYRVYMSFALSVIRRAVRDGFTSPDPAHDFVIGGVSSKPRDIMTPDEYKVLRDSAVDDQTRNIIMFIMATGCRISEVHALRCSDVRLDGHSTAHVIIQCGKGGKFRQISIDPATAGFLATVIGDRGGDDLAFPTQAGAAWDYSNWRRHKWLPTMKAAKAAGLPRKFHDLTPHGLRHTHASWLLVDGVDIRVLSARLGHASPAFTLNTYIHVTKKGDERMMEVLGEQSRAILE